MFDTGSALHRAILLHPADDDRRLVYADWLEEHGDVDRAEFVRAQVELACMTYRPACDHRYRPATIPPLPTPKCPGCRYDKRLRALRRRERELWLLLYNRMASEANRAMRLPRVTSEGCSIGWCPTPISTERIVTTWHRGFIDSIECTEAAWREHGSAVMRQHPVTRVVLVDKRPNYQVEWSYYWFSAKAQGGKLIAQHDLADYLFDLLANSTADTPYDRGYPTPKAALDALSDAAVLWARLEALGVPCESGHLMRECPLCQGRGRVIPTE